MSQVTLKKIINAYGMVLISGQDRIFLNFMI